MYEKEHGKKNKRIGRDEKRLGRERCKGKWKT
jgi:hypothetical protein